MKAFCAVLLLSICLSAPARADLDLSLGGHMVGYGVYVDQDAPGDLHNFGLRREAKLSFGGETKLESGLTVGAATQVYIERARDSSVDVSYIYVQDEWGRTQLGETKGAGELLQVGAPYADKYIDSLDPKISGFDLDALSAGPNIPNTLTYEQDPAGSAAKIVYLTPVLSGFQAAVSLAPGVDDTDLAGIDAMPTDKNTGQYDLVTEAAARYETAFAGVNWVMGAGIGHAGLEAADASPANQGSDARLLWNAGIEAGVGDWTLGAALVHDNNGIERDGDTLIRVAGLNYEHEDTVYGLSYQYRTDETAFAGTDKAEIDRVTAGAVHEIAPGLTLRGSASYTDVSRGNLGGNGVQAAFGTAVAF